MALLANILLGTVGIVCDYHQSLRAALTEEERVNWFEREVFWELPRVLWRRKVERRVVEAFRCE
jgi:hypothetical protein